MALHRTWQADANRFRRNRPQEARLKTKGSPEIRRELGSQVHCSACSNRALEQTNGSDLAIYRESDRDPAEAPRLVYGNMKAEVKTAGWTIVVSSARSNGLASFNHRRFQSSDH